MSETATHHSPVLMDNPEAYTKRAVLTYGRLKTVEDFEAKAVVYTDDQKKLVELEAQMFGINPFTNPEDFVDAHARFVTEVEEDLQESLPRIKKDIVDRVASYFAKDDEATKEGLKNLMNRRLADTREVGVYDSLYTNSSGGGFFNGVARQPHLAISELASAVEASESHADYKEKIEKVMLAHEVMHGIFTSGTQATAMHDHWPIRNGLSVDLHTNPNDFMEDKIIKHGVWLNEATLESFRKDLFKTEDVRYEPGVILIETLDELSPGLRDELVLAALDSKGPGPVFAKVEELLGPTGIEAVEELLKRVKRFADFPEYKATVVSMLPKELQTKANDVFNRKEQEIFGSREWYREKIAKLAASSLNVTVERPQ